MTRSNGISWHLQTLFSTGSLGRLTDQELLARFAVQHDEDAFATLVERHAPMVFRICRTVLHNSHDAEDAAQATFLILSRKAGSIRSGESLASWLFGVARRVSVRALTELSKSRKREQRVAEKATLAVEDGVPTDRLSEVCDELERLPEKYRIPIILCDLEGVTHEQAAAQLRLSARTLRRRLASGRERMRDRLARRGFSQPAGLPGIALAQAASRRALPAAWSDSTVRIVMRSSVAADRVVSWVEGVIAMMFWTKLKMAVGLGLLLGLIAAGASVFAIDAREGPDVQGATTEVSSGSGAQRATAVDHRQAVGRISDRIGANYAQIRTLRARLTTTTLDRSVTKREEVTNVLPGGVTARYVREPSTVRRERILLRGDDLLRESMEEDGHTWSFLGGVWTQYSPRSRMAWLRLPDQMAGMSPLDPRNIASLEQRSLFVDRLREDRVLEAGPTRTSDGQLRMSVLLEHAFDKERTERYRCDFDPARNDLPTRIVVYRKGDGIGIVLDIEYQEVIPGAAWFLQKSTLKFFYPELARSPDSEAWRQSSIVEATGEVQVNGKIDDDAFVVKLPEGTRVSDSVHRSVYTSGDKLRPDDFTRLRMGDVAPDFEATTLDGETVRLSRLRGKVVLIHHFATWCGPCVAELPRVENEIWRRFREKNLVVLAMGREHTAAELASFRKEHGLTMSMAADPRREIYERFAEQGVPRNYVIDAEGKVVHQSVGYSDPKFNELVKSIEAATNTVD